MVDLKLLNMRMTSEGHTDAAPPIGGVETHDAEFGAAAVSGNGNGEHQTVTERLRSRMRRLDFMASAELFRHALHMTGASQADVAAAADVSTARVGKWCRGEATIPADVVRILLRRLTPVGIEILYLCAADLPLDGLAGFAQRINQLLKQRLEVRGQR